MLDFASSLQDEITGSRRLIDGGWAVNETMTQSLAALRNWIHAKWVISGSRPEHFRVNSDLNTVGILIDTPVFDHDYVQRVWADSVREYITLSLTVSSNKFAALEGLASWFKYWADMPAARSSKAHTEAGRTGFPLDNSEPTKRPRLHHQSASFLDISQD